MKLLNNLKRGAMLGASMLILLLVAGCKSGDGKPISYTPTNTYCINGVLYYSLYYRLAPAFNTDSTVKLCN